MPCQLRAPSANSEILNLLATLDPARSTSITVDGALKLLTVPLNDASCRTHQATHCNQSRHGAFLDPHQSTLQWSSTCTGRCSLPKSRLLVMSDR